MDKMKMESVNMTAQNIERIAELFPNCITEMLDEKKSTPENKVYKKAINFEMLKQMLSGDVLEGDEAYEFTWVGKKAAIVEANKPIRKTLRPCKEESENWDTTENLYIEGDNLEVLKLLQESYLGKVKMIYIDPPYNTGNDFIYCDNFKQSTDEYETDMGVFDEIGNRMFKNTDTNGRFHSDWCSMIYSRLMLARNLLQEDGVIFIHIDDNEVETLGKLCNEVFGEDNFINIVTVKTKIGGVSGSSEGKSLKDATEFIWIYAKNKNSVLFNPVYIQTPLFDRIKSYEAEGKSWKYTSIMTKLEGKILLKDDEARGMKFYGYNTLETMSISAFAKEQGTTVEDIYNRYADRIFRTTNAQSSVRQTVIRETSGFEYPMYGCEYIPIKGKNEGQTIEILYKAGSTNDQRNMMMFLSDVVEKINGIYYYMDKVTSLWDDIDYNNLTKEGNMEFPNGKKPIKLLQRLLSLSTDSDSIVVDFFSGSGSTAHATMQQNLEDNGKRKFIMIQLPEQTESKEFPTICEIGKERIRRAAKKIAEENPSATFDGGFRVLKLDESNMKDVYYSAGDYNQDMLAMLESNIKDDRNDLDLLFGCLLEWGLPLSMPYTSETIEGCTVHTYNEGDLVACFNENIPDSVVKAIAKRQPLRVVFRDSSFAGSPAKINVGEVFKLLAPDTRVKVI